MLFSSPVFFLFFAIYFGLHLVVPVRHRVFLIIAGSAIFYAWWKVEYAWLPFLLAAIAYYGVAWMERAPEQARRKRRAAIAISVLFIPLVAFKYTNFLYWRGSLLELSLPLGVSFVTFTLTAYIVDVYRRRFPTRVHPSTLLAYVLFFPHLIAGPILRPRELIPQLERPRAATLRRLAPPLALLTVGLIKKLVFADQISEVVDAMYRQSGPVSGPSALLAIYGFSVQIYCDFSGYTDMAIGIAALLGVRLPYNFQQPYAARSIVDFWRRWHITLSFWLRDYLYIALGGSRRGRLQETRNILITMALGGLWHGANWTFVIWGIYHGLWVACTHWVTARRWAPLGVALPHWLAVVLTFHVVAIGWVFFRAPTIGIALQMLRAPVVGNWAGASGVVSANAFVLLLIVVFFLVHQFDDPRRVKAAGRFVRPEILWPVLVALWLVAITISQGISAKFIYFDF
jgi:D-alanyl-lipoteichoic acid acyltransferase DltB (MBOAT superfamily)